MIQDIVIKTKIGTTKDGKAINGKTKAKMLVEGGSIYLAVMGFNKAINVEIKSMEGHHWHGKIPNSDYKPKPFPEEFKKVVGSDKVWSIADSHRNRFNLSHLLGGNPYAHYDKPIECHSYDRTLYVHQKEMADFVLTRHYCILAGEMGTGKTLCAIEVMERSGFDDWWYIAPRSVLRAIEREIKIWDAKVRPRLLTYEQLVTIMKDWPEGQKAPKGIIVDESARTKTPTAQRSQAVKQLADGVRSDWGADGFVTLMSGAPAPKSPVDWWHQCEIACPGFLKEGTLAKFKLRLGVFREEESFSGGVFQKHITWRDDENKCGICGEYPDSKYHIPGATREYHAHVKSVNEVAQLYKRMKGLVLVKFKKDCLDLPDKIYREVICKATPAVMRTAKLISKSSKTTIEALTLLRELSDGFQYVDEKDGTQVCSLCNGRKRIIEKVAADEGWKDAEVDCPACDGSGEEDKIIRTTQQVACPKEDVFRELLDEHHDIGRLVTYAGFTGSIDRCVETALSEDYSVIRVDGRGWKFYGKDEYAGKDYLELFQEGFDKYPRVCFIGHPGSAGEGLTLTASPTIFYYSNTFNANERIQSEDRIHRLSMDVNRGATIIDCFHLETDRLIFENLKKKRELQALSLGDLRAVLDAVSEDDERLI